MNKGSLTQFVKGNTAHRFPKVVALAISSCVLVSMIAIDASASPGGLNSAVAGSTTHPYAFAPESSLGQLFGFGRYHRVPVNSSSTSSTTTTVSTTVSAGTSAGTIGGGGGAPTTTTSTPPASPTTTTTSPATTTTTAPPTSTPSVSSSSGLITAGPSRSECIDPDNASSLSQIQSSVNSWDAATGSTVTCLLAYLNGAQAWSDWSNPWITQSQYGYNSWVAQAPQSRQLVLDVNLIPSSLADVANPLSWEQSCAAGDFNNYATELGTNLVAAGLQNSVIRLGTEMNGPWELDFVGNTTQEQGLWAQCFANEVTGLRQAAGEHFLMDWDINSCTQPIPYANYYPGNAYVDIIGIDQYNGTCASPNTPVTFAQLASEPYGLNALQAFATAQGKPMSIPEWGLSSSPSGDDPSYIDGIASTVANGDYAFEAYFNVVDGGTMLLNSSTPQSLAAYSQAFGS